MLAVRADAVAAVSRGRHHDCRLTSVGQVGYPREAKCFLTCIRKRREWRSVNPGSRAAAPPAAREGPDGRRLARGVARPAAGARERRLRGPLRAIVQAGLRRPAAPVPAHAARRAGQDAAPRDRPVHHRDRLPHWLGEPGHVRAHLPRHHRREPGRDPGAREGRGARARPRARLHPQRRTPAPPHDSSFGEATPGRGQ